jgi:hypothetical protein
MPPARRTNTATKPTATKPKFSVSALKAEVELVPFEFEHGGKDWVMAHAQSLSVWKIDELVDGTGTGKNTDAIVAMFQAALGDQWAEFSQIPLAGWQLNELAGAYGEHCGINMGESKDSAAS